MRTALVMAFGLWVAGQVLGLPHLRYSYDFNAEGHNPMLKREYLRCTYIGPHGSFTVRPTDGNCRLIVLWRGS